MGQITFKLDDTTEKIFRKLIPLRFPYKKGAIGEAIAEALNLWFTEYFSAAQLKEASK